MTMSTGSKSLARAFRADPGEGRLGVALRNFRPDVSDQGFAIGLYLEHLEEASFLYEQRLALLDDPEVSWPDLAGFEDRLEAHLDALVLGGELALSVCRQHAMREGGDTGEYHATITVICRHRRLDLLHAALEPLDPANDERIRAAGDALGRELPSEWGGDVLRMLSAGHAGLRRIAARVIGFRRLGAVPQLAASVSIGGAYALPEMVWALGRSREPAAQPVLRRIFEEERNATLKGAVALALLRVGDRSVIGACLREAQRYPSLLSAVGVGGGRTNLRVLLDLYSAGEVRADCLVAMGLLGDVSAVGMFLAALDHAATADAAATALNLITGADLYEQVFVPELSEEDELFDDEQKDTKGQRPTNESCTGSRLTRLTRDPAKWRAWWSNNAPRFRPQVRYRGGRPYSPLRVLETLTAGRNGRRVRELACQELVIRYGVETPFETDMLVADQRRALVELARWAKGAEAMYRPGVWYLAAQPLEC